MVTLVRVGMFSRNDCLLKNTLEVPVSIMYENPGREEGASMASPCCLAPLCQRIAHAIQLLSVITNFALLELIK